MKKRESILTKRILAGLMLGQQLLCPGGSGGRSDQCGDTGRL